MHLLVCVLNFLGGLAVWWLNQLNQNQITLSPRV